jgi:hypothetical protein
LPEWIHNIRKSAATKREGDEIVWNRMAQFQGTSEDWGSTGWRGGRPRDFAEAGEAIYAEGRRTLSGVIGFTNLFTRRMLSV